MEDTYRRFGGVDAAVGGLGSPLGAYRQQVTQAGVQQQHQQLHHHHHHHHHLSPSASSSSSSSSAPAAATLGHGGPYQQNHMTHGVPQFSGAVSGFCNGDIGNVGELPYQEMARGGGAAAAWYGNPDPSYQTSKKMN